MHPLSHADWDAERVGIMHQRQHQLKDYAELPGLPWGNPTHFAERNLGGVEVRGWE